MFSQYIAVFALLLVIVLIHAINDREIAKTYMIRLGIAVYFVESLRVMIT